MRHAREANHVTNADRLSQMSATLADATCTTHSDLKRTLVSVIRNCGDQLSISHAVHRSVHGPSDPAIRKSGTRKHDRGHERA